MKSVIINAALALLLSTQAASAQSVSKQLYEIGYDACTLAMRGELQDVDGSHYRRIVDESSMNRVEFCGCVAEDFGTGDKNDLAALKSAKRVDQLSLMSVMAMTGCLPESDDDVTDGDLAGTDFSDGESELDPPEEDFAYDESDVNMCRMALDGDLMTPGFNNVEVVKKIKSNGQTIGDVCICAGRYFTAGGESLQKEIEEAGNPTIVYASTMAGAINICVN
jgi:hypothetical protein